WYADAPVAWPISSGASDAAALGGRLAQCLAAEGLAFETFHAEVVPEARLNAQCADANKADALFATASALFDRSPRMRRGREEGLAVFDRHGGRRFYAPLFARRWPAALPMTLGESPRRSAYRIHFADGPADVAFEVEADAGHPHVGLASMAAKYLRE